jgi:ATP-dependent Lhr-like helicase
VRAHALARTLLDRHGVVTRGAVAAEGVEGGFSAVYRILSAFEETGQARRGYVVEGLGAAQFAMDGAVDRLRAAANARDRGEALPPEGFSSPFPAADPGFQPDFTGSRGAPDFGFEFPAETGRGPAVPTVDGSDSHSSPADFGTPPGAGFLDGSGAASDFRFPGDGEGTSDDFPFPGDFGSPNGSDPFATGPRSERPGRPTGNRGWANGASPRGGAPGGRSRANGTSRAVVLAAADPANANGAALSWPEPPTGAGHKPGRKAGSLVVLVDGELTLYMERGGKTLLAWPSTPDSEVIDDPRLRSAAEALSLAARAGSLGTVTVERVNGASALTAPLGTLLEAAGFIATPRGLRIRA